jgi:hypothetical protein
MGIEGHYQRLFRGMEVKSVKTAFKTALRLAAVRGRVTPHTLRHTRRRG